MKVVGLFDAKNRLSEVCEGVVYSGEPVTVTRRGKPWVRIVPIIDSDAKQSVWDTVEEARATYGALTEEPVIPDRKTSDIRPDPLGDDA